MIKSLSYAVIIIAVLATASIADLPKISAKEKAVFAFFDLGNTAPDFDAWILNSKRYINAHKLDKPEIYKRELMRLKDGFDLYKANPELITIKKNIRLSTTVDQTGQRLLNIRFPYQDKNNTQSRYFSFPYGQENIAVIVDELNEFESIALSNDNIPVIKKHFFNSTPYEANIQINLKPKTADMTAPIRIDDKEQWLMAAAIDSIKITYFDDYALENVIIWSYEAQNTNKDL